MVSKRVFIIFFFVISFVNASNILKSVDVKKDTLILTFAHPLKRGDFIASAIKGTKLTRYVFDFKKCKLSSKVKRAIKLKGDLKSIRVAQYKRNITRLVIDSKKAYSIKYHQINSQFTISIPKKVTLAKAKEDKKSVKKSIEKTSEKTTKKVSAKNLFDFISDKVKVIPTIYSTNLKRKYTIVIDPGHGGKKPGTIHNGIKEKAIVLQIAKRVYRRLKKAGFKVVMTRYRDKHVPLRSRIRIANRKNADIFVSIHINSIPKDSTHYGVHGVETYYLISSAKATRRALRMAARENADLLKDKDSATKKLFINEIFTGPKRMLSHKLAIDVQRNIVKNLRKSYNYIKDGGAKGAPYYVLVGAQMPAILVETGYLSNPKERARLQNAHYQELLAKGIVDGIISYLKNREKELE